MKIKYKITDFPSKTDSYNVPAYTEGNIDLIVESGKVIVTIENVLLVELAIVLSKWLKELKNGNKKDLNYSSMDFEEEPLIAFKLLPNDEVIVSSIFNSDWKETISIKNVVSGCELYIHDLCSEVRKKYRFDLENRIEQEMGKK